MNIGIIGKGFVGTAISEGFKTQGHDVIVHDVRLETKITDVLSTPILYISVPTPSAPNGDCDTSIVESVLQELFDLNYKGAVCVKSTVKPGSIDGWKEQFDSLNISFVPEFLREKCAVEDFIYNNQVLVIGTEDDEAEIMIRECHGALPVHTVRMKPIEAELVKYFSNSYKAMRVTFANAFYRLSESLGANYDVVKDAFLFHGIGDGHYLRVNKEFGGFGGTCLPKDTRGLANLVDELGLDIDLFKTIVSENEKFTDVSDKENRKEI
jgi:UDPglucose 6-dehydrogenase|tara:strand:- start:16 stop:816 length:801 start_codon:yes stop_codon:yes gene_type:complete